MRNCFTVAYNYLNVKYGLPTEWEGYTPADMDLFVEKQGMFLAKKQHIKFFKSFCDRVKSARKDDIILTKTSVGVAINRFSYWVWVEKVDKIEHEILDKDCLIMRIR